MSYYIGATGLDIFEDAISDAIEETTNTLTTLIITQDNLQAGYSSNYVLSTSNILVQRTKQLEDRVDDLEGGEGSAGDPNADPPIPPIPPTGNFAILATLGVLTAGATALAIVVADLDDKVDLNNIYTSNYVKITSNILIGRISDTSNYVKITSNILIGRINDTSNYVLSTSNILIELSAGRINDTSNYVLSTSNILIGRINDTSNYVLNSSNILVKRITDEVGFGSNYVLSTCNILVPRIMTEVGFGSNYVVSTCNILIDRIITEVGYTSNYVLSTSNILVPRIMQEVGFTSNYVLNTSNILVTRIVGLGTNYWTQDAGTNIYLNQAGNVGIGTNDPLTYKLNVAGSINATSLLINGTQISGNLSQGMVVQMKHLTYTQMDVKNNVSWDAINDNLATGFVIAITPSNTSSKVLVNMIAHIGTEPTSDSRWWGIKLYRKIGAGGAWTEITGANGTETGAAAAAAGTPVWVSHNLGSVASGNEYLYFVANVSGTYLDAPNTTSIVYYTAYWNQRVGDTSSPATNIYINRSASQDGAYRVAPSSSWTATEIWDLGTPYIPPVGDTTITITSGNVGIGAGPNALYKLSVAGDINVTGLVRVNGTAITGSKWSNNSADATKIYYNGGNVGIGHTNPAYKLHIKCSYDVIASGLHLDASDGGAADRYTLTIYPYVIASGEVGYKFRTQNYYGGTHTPLTLNNYGNVVINNNLNAGSINSGSIIASSYVLAPAIYGRNSYDTLMYADSGGMYLKFGSLNTGNSDYLEITAYNGATNINSGSNRTIYMRTSGFAWTYVNQYSYNPSNSFYWNITSDQRIKKNIKKSNLKICYDNVKNINLYRFNYIDGVSKGFKQDKTQLGFIAQQVKQHFPKSVKRGKMRIDDKREIPDLLNVDIGQINMSLFGAVKQLMKVVEKQSKRIKKLEEMLGIVDDDEVDNDADEPYTRINYEDEVDIDTIEPNEPIGV